MNLVTIEVDIDHGRITPRGPESLPEKGKGLLTLLPDLNASLRQASVSGFIAKWAGAFTSPGSPEDDSRMAYLLGKHAK
jgi:hypothetical protein